MSWDWDEVEPNDPRVRPYARMVALETGEPMMSDELAAAVLSLELMCKAAEAHVMSTPEGRARVAADRAREAYLATWHPVYLKARELPLDGPLPDLIAASKRLYGDSGQKTRADVNMVRLIAEWQASRPIDPTHEPSGALQQRPNATA
jgi:hypothetical protein